VTGGNVSLYNESPTGAVYPTPVIGMIGLIDDLAHVTPATFRNDGDSILLLGDITGELGGSEYLATIHGVVGGTPPACDLDREKGVIDALLDAIRAGVVSSAHDCSDGGIGVALAECCVANRESVTGADVDLSSWSMIAARRVLFGEDQGRVVVSSSSPERVLAIAAAANVPCTRIGTVRSASGSLSINLGPKTINAPLRTLIRAYHDSIPSIMARTTEHTTFDELSQVAAH
jgi:phosphoribosylformylglycinamidine (FGAM) synthase-like enzyme